MSLHFRLTGFLPSDLRAWTTFGYVLWRTQVVRALSIVTVDRE